VPRADRRGGARCVRWAVVRFPVLASLYWGSRTAAGWRIATGGPGSGGRWWQQRNAASLGAAQRGRARGAAGRRTRDGAPRPAIMLRRTETLGLTLLDPAADGFAAEAASQSSPLKQRSATTHRLLVLVLVAASAGAAATLKLVYGQRNCPFAAPMPQCTYNNNMTVDAAVVPLLGTLQPNRTACCITCKHYEGCAAAVFHSDPTTAGEMGLENAYKCLLYSADAAAVTDYHNYSALCMPPQTVSEDGETSSASISSAFSRWLNTLLGAAALLARFMPILSTFLQSQLLGCCGFSGVSLTQFVLAPRMAKAVADTLQQSKRSPTPEAASWGAIVGDPMAMVARGAAFPPPSSWEQTRSALGLDWAPALWVSGLKLLFWHWSQPLAYLLVLDHTWCQLKNTANYGADAQTLALIVAWREISYLLTTLVCIYLNPAFLLLELRLLQGMVEEEGEEEERSQDVCYACRHWCQTLDIGEIKKGAIYFLAPHHYATACAMRRAANTELRDMRGTSDLAQGYFPWLLLLGLQFLADSLSVILLIFVLGQPDADFPAPLAFGYALTTAGLGVGAAGVGLGSISIARNPRAKCGERAIGAVGGLVIGGMGGYGLWLALGLTPLRLLGWAPSDWAWVLMPDKNATFADIIAGATSEAAG
jgi:hypothetical protein